MREFFTNRFTTIGSFLSTQRFSWTDLKNIFHWDYWSEVNIPPQSPYALVSLLVTVAVIVGLVFWRRRLKAAEAIAPIYVGVINQLANIIAFIVIMAVSYFFFRLQAIAYLSSRLVVLSSGVIVLGWIGWVIFYLTRIASAKRREYLERERFFRYLPKKKEKR